MSRKSHVLLECKSNLTLTYRERGKIKTRSRGHNIFLSLGRIWLPDAISYSALPTDDPPSPTPVTKVDDRGVRYMGVGIGGSRNSTAAISAVPLSTHYPGTNLQTDSNPAVLRLERPVRLTCPVPSSPSLPPYNAADVWLGQVQAPAVKPTTTSVRFTRLFSESEISFGPYAAGVPISEILLVLHSTSASYIHTSNNTGIAYDTFDPFPKTSNLSLQVDWELRF